MFYIFNDKRAYVMKLLERDDFKNLFDLYYPRLVLFASKYLNNSSDVEDCVLESFSSLWENKGKIENEEYVKSYLYVSVRNKCLNVIRYNKVRNMVGIEEVYDIQDDTSVELSVIDSELHAMLLGAIRDLPGEARRVLELSVFEKVKLHEIAEQMDLSLNQVKALKTKALRELKKKLGGKFLVISILFGLV